MELNGKHQKNKKKKCKLSICFMQIVFPFYFTKPINQKKHCTAELTDGHNSNIYIATLQVENETFITGQGWNSWWVQFVTTRQK